MLGKIIDFSKKGNVVRLYFGDKDLGNYTGDDWDRTPYEYNATRVYNEFIIGHQDLFFDFDDLVLEPADNSRSSSQISKNDLKENKIPAIIVVPSKIINEKNIVANLDDFDKWCFVDGVIKIYLGTVVEFDNQVSHGPTLELLNNIKDKSKGSRKKYGTNLGLIANPKATRRSSTGVKGVYKLCNGTYVARININKKEYSVGYFDTLEEAKVAREEAENKFYKPIIMDAIQHGYLAQMEDNND